MASPVSFDAISPRFRGFDAYFRAEIQPMAPGLARAPRTGAPLWRRLAIAAAVLYLAAAPAALILYPVETADYRPWALASGGVLMLGVLLALAPGGSREPRAVVSANVWSDVRARIARFFGLRHGPAPDRAAIQAAVSRAPAPVGAAALKVETYVGGVIERGDAAGVVVELIEGRTGGRQAVLLAFGFDRPAPGLAAILDDRIPDVPRQGLEAMAVPAPLSPTRAVSIYAENPAMAERIADAAFLEAFSGRLAAMGVDAGNLAVVDGWARLYLALPEPWLIPGDATPGPGAVGEALADYDAVLRLAETLSPLFPETER